MNNTLLSLGRIFAGIVWSSASLFAQNASEQIRLNQVGFYPKAVKHAILIGKDHPSFYLIAQNTLDTVFSGKLGGNIKSPFSEKYSQLIDFSGFQQQGTYYLYVPHVGNSYPFSIKPKIHHEVAKAAIKGYYYQRATVDLPTRYAGKWARPAGHPDNKVLVHASAVSENRPEGTVISSPKGWYDAGDYNKYVVNSGITMATLLSSYEDFKAIAGKLQLNIPESNNQLPDLIDEILWNLRWMQTMQDPNDGGVYHKLTNAAFDGMIMPHKATKTRYVVQKNTIATLDFAAVMAQASRILKPFARELPQLSDSCLIAAQKAWDWAIKNPSVYYRQNDNNQHFKPAITTGGYEDKSNVDEWFWASAELFVTTHQKTYFDAIQWPEVATIPIATWNQVMPLGYYSLIRNEANLPDFAKEKILKLKEQLLNTANLLVDKQSEQLYHTVMGKTAKDFMWGSSSHAANQGILLVQAYWLTKQSRYLEAALGNIDYLLGRNGTGYSFLTGYGTKQVLHPHHRPSIADGIAEPIPGLLSGGPNPGQQDKCVYTSSVPDESFSDHDCSYASNEIAINWNAPLVYLAIALEAHLE